jgi:serine/threonine protein kinase
MGNQLAAPIVDYQLHELPGVDLREALGGGRFLRTLLCVHDEGQLVVKVFAKSPRENLHAVKAVLEQQRAALAGRTHVLPWARSIQTDRMAYLVRQHVAHNYADLVSTRPFLSPTEKHWIMYQLLIALVQLRDAGVTHRDIKAENVLVTLWKWVLIADLAPYKPWTLPDDNPSLFSFYFDTSGRRLCYVAPERFGTSHAAAGGSAAAASAAASAAAPLPLDAGAPIAPNADAVDAVPVAPPASNSSSLAYAADIFSAGCTLLEMFADGEGPFDLSALLDLRAGRRTVAQALAGVSDARAAQVIARMIAVRPEERPSARDLLHIGVKNGLFPPYFGHLHRVLEQVIVLPADKILPHIADAIERACGSSAADDAPTAPTKISGEMSSPARSDAQRDRDRRRRGAAQPESSVQDALRAFAQRVGGQAERGDGEAHGEGRRHASPAPAGQDAPSAQQPSARRASRTPFDLASVRARARVRACVCACACLRVRASVRARARVHASVRARARARVHASVRARARARVRASVRARARARACVCARACARLCVRVHASVRVRARACACVPARVCLTALRCVQLSDDDRRDLVELLLSALLAFMRMTSEPSALVAGLRVLAGAARVCSKAFVLSHLVPHAADLVRTDWAEPCVRAEAVRTTASLVRAVRCRRSLDAPALTVAARRVRAQLGFVVPRSGALLSASDVPVLQFFVLPTLQTATNDSDDSVRIALASSLGSVASSMHRFVDSAFAWQRAQVQSSGSDAAVVASTYDDVRAHVSGGLVSIAQALLQDGNTFVRTAMASSLLPLCVSLGLSATSDHILPMAVTLVSDKDWMLRAAFLDAVVAVACVIGPAAFDQFLFEMAAVSLTGAPGDVQRTALRVLLRA